jgi:electron transfer flavoprotein alpha subunit
VKPLVFLEHNGDALSKGALGVLTKAATLGDDVAAVLVGAGPLDALAAEAGRFGAVTVLIAEDPSFDPPLPQPRVDVLDGVVRNGGYDTILFSNSVLAGDIAAGLAARLDAGLNWDLVDLATENGDLVGKQPALGDSLLATVGWRSAKRVALFRAGSFDATASGGEARVERVTPDVQPHSRSATIVSSTPRASEGSSIDDADVIVAGGLGLGGAENLSLAEELASELGGVVGVTRAVVYKGWAPHAMQIGQTGKTVSPKLYIALGISGAVQHKVGMQNSKTIVAVNTDKNAPIFEFSDLGVIGDVHTIVPQLIELLRGAHG